MATTDISKTNGTAIAGLDGIVDQSGVDGGILRIYGGAVPTDADATPSATELADFALNTPAFGNSVQDGNDARSDIQGTPLQTTADANGTATHWRILNAAATTTYFQGECDTTASGTGSLNFDDVVFSLGGTVTVNSLSVRLAE